MTSWFKNSLREHFLCETMINFCKFSFGKSLILEGGPTSCIYDKSFLFHNSLYDSNNKLIQVSSYTAGENLKGIFNHHIYAPETAKSKEISGVVIEDSFWMGYFHTHYGHFLLSTLQRLWNLGPHKNLIISPNFDKSSVNKFDYIKIILESLEINPEKIISPSSGCELKNITVSQPFFVENYFCYSMWGDFMRHISQKIINNFCKNPSEIPVYISRSKIKSGTRIFNGEIYLSEILKKFGIETFYLEEMSFMEQLNFWNKHNIFIGFSGSSFITSSFFENKKLIIINHDDYVFGSQLMVDKLSRNKSIYINIENFLSVDKEYDNNFTIFDYNTIVSKIMYSIRMVNQL
ncbi:glycosyltransferase 61 family protein [Gluconobacter wancherniae]|uniref:glycosyltransferase 61 family protein n=1 Tax=Gluconobacter wancherniae TaxID=1307955 RepID=UPI001B8C4055|nr:glycosyltransferase family 61 protein [Gluconobacter wancherniae]MBS1089821.1 glycosyltransferase family 61 protein [Gluconobacter wancherniae]